MNRYDDWLRTDAHGIVAEQMTVAHVHIPAAQVVAADTDGILDGTAFPAAAGVVKEFLAQPPWPLNITMVCSGTQTGKAVVHGLDINDEPISEDFELTSTTQKVGAKAFKKVLWIALPQKVASETVDVGWGKKYGLPFRIPNAGYLLVKQMNGTNDTGTLAVDKDELSENTFTPNGNGNGEKALDLYILI